MNDKSPCSRAVYIHEDARENRGGLSRFFTLLRILVNRELKGRYRRSILGPVWAVIQPLLYLLIFMFIRGVLDIPSDGIPYPLFAYSALVPWTLFSGGITRSSMSITQNKAIINKVSVSKELFPIISVSAVVIDFLISLALLFLMMFFFKVPVGRFVLWVPIITILIILLSVGISLGFTALGTYKDDFRFALPFLMQVWMLASPVIYPVGKVPAKWQLFYKLNPMVGLIEGFRNALIKNAAPDFGLLWVSLAAIVGVWIVAWPLFRYLSRYFSDVL
ncbi:MAG: ABC transporter permease [Deltaproteobacteria bacterium]|uniref:Transport permease protein n=1 Tax=Candidatus Zymogenus saltonus TaxID=2844893 RepID=A0A9D8PNU8_9DELT|nr:ABC transporter permease [Candidatus Zymogenus saltonus]